MSLQRVLVLALTAVFIWQSDSFPMPNYQVLPQKIGYVPVYIRFGDQPLYEINPELAQAFHENSIRARQIKADDNPEAIMNADIGAAVDTSVDSAAESSDKVDNDTSSQALSEINGNNNVEIAHAGESKDNYNTKNKGNSNSSAVIEQKKKKLAETLSSDKSTSLEESNDSESSEELNNRKKRSDKQTKNNNKSESDSSQSSATIEENTKN